MGSAAQLAVTGARIRTLDPANPWASAVAIRDGVIVAVGSDAAVRGACDSRTRTIDGSGSVITPGITDSHQHPFWGLEWTRGAELSGMTRLDDIRAALAAERDRVGPGGWILGRGLAYVAFDDVGGLHHSAIEDATGGLPTFLITFDGHTALASKRALQLSGVDGPHDFEQGAEVVCDDQGRPTGELREPGAMELVRHIIPPMTADERLAAIRRVHGSMNACGITAVHAMDGKPGDVEALRELEASGEMRFRIVWPLWQEPHLTLDEMRAQLALRDVRGRLWRGGVAKFFIDGVIETGTAWLHDEDTAGRGVTPFWPDPDHYVAAVQLFAAAGFQCATHAVGERGVRCALEAYASAPPPPPGVRHRIEHIETLPDIDIARFGAESVTASMQILHMENMTVDQADPWSRALGPERCGRAFRVADIAAERGPIALGSDWPVAHYDPRRGMAWARLRREPGHPERDAYGTSQRLSAEATLAGYTTGAAWAVGEEAVAGRIKIGFRGDLTGWAADPVECAADDLPSLPVTLTVVDGAVRHGG